MTRDGLIHFVCLARDHCASRDPGLTEHEGQWALCPQLLGTGHEWYDTGGVPVRDAVVLWHKLMDGAGAPEPVPAA